MFVIHQVRNVLGLCALHKSNMIPVTSRSKARMCDRSLAGIAVWNPLLRVLCFVK